MIESNTRITLLSINEAGKLFTRFIQTYAREILALFVIQILLDQGIEHLSGMFKSGANQSISLIISILLLSMFSEFFLNNAFLLLASKAFRGQSSLELKDFDDYSQMIVEEVRLAGKVLMGFILFLFPGFNRLVEYSWVPFVVLFEDDYREGKIDALVTSKFIARGHFWYLSSILTITSIASYATDYLITGGESSIFANRLPVLAAAVIGILLNLFFKLFYCALYQHSRKRSQQEIFGN